jgi:hypothetical protein
MKPPPAPKTLSAAIRLGLADLAKVEQDERYVVRMNTWHMSFDHEPCRVCLAGAVMAYTCRAPVGGVWWPNDFPEWRDVFIALNEVRQGWLADALFSMSPRPSLEAPLYGKCVDLAEEYGAYEVPLYEADPAGFRRELLRVAAWLEERGL